MTLHDGTAHSLAAHARAARKLATPGLSQALASGGHGGHRLQVLLIVVAVIVVAAIAWIILAGRARRNRGE
jgi:hypothetical protein